MTPVCSPSSACSISYDPALRKTEGDEILSIASNEAARDTLALLTVASALFSLELWAIRADFRVGGILDPRVLPRPGLSRLLPELALVQVGLLAVALLGWDRADLRGVAAAGSLTTSALLYVALRFGRDGSDDIGLSTTFALSAALVVDRAWAVDAALLAIAGMAMIAYTAAGIAKLRGASWRNGTALPAVLRSASYGAPALGRLATHHARISRLAGYAVIAVEVLLPVAVLIGGRWAVALLALAACFHLGVAAAMGLNRFAPAFLATYPALLWLGGNAGPLR